MRSNRWRAVGVAGVAGLTLLAAGCAGYSPAALQPGASADEVTQSLGKPTGEYGAADGGRRLEFAHGPFGYHTFMVDLDAQGRMTGWSQVLTEENFNTLHAGMAQADVLSRIGHPSESSTIAWQKRALWSYRYETPFCQWFQVGIDRAGKVVDTGYGPDPLCQANDNRPMSE